MYTHVHILCIECMYVYLCMCMCIVMQCIGGPNDSDIEGL